MLIGYARVFSNDQDTVARVAALKAAKCAGPYQVAEHSWRRYRPTRYRTCLFCGLLRRQRRIPKFSNKARTGYLTGRL